jgi:hypothetical protein
LWPGEDWRAKISGAISRDALVFIACFSSHSAARERNYQNEELFLAIDRLRRRRPDDPWLIPVRFDDCDVPDFELGTGRTFASIHRADLSCHCCVVPGSGLKAELADNAVQAPLSATRACGRQYCTWLSRSALAWPARREPRRIRATLRLCRQCTCPRTDCPVLCAPGRWIDNLIAAYSGTSRAVGDAEIFRPGQCMSSRPRVCRAADIAKVPLITARRLPIGAGRIAEN